MIYSFVEGCADKCVKSNYIVAVHIFCDKINNDFR